MLGELKPDETAPHCPPSTPDGGLAGPFLLVIAPLPAARLTLGPLGSGPLCSRPLGLPF